MQNKKTGQGKMVCMKDGKKISEYDGAWKDDMRHGQGVMTWYTAEGTATYNGNWVKDVKEGRGMYKWPNGTCYDGEW